MSRYNTLLHGAASAAADALIDIEASNDELRVALINALVRIDRLEEHITNLRKELAE